MFFFDLKFWKNGLISLIFSNSCISCHQPLIEYETRICISCLHSLPTILPNSKHENIVSYPKQVVLIHSLWSLHESNILHILIHQLKYQYNMNLGIYLGRFWGKKIRQNRSLFQWILDNNPLFIALPLHIKSQNKRGYNQSQLLIDGIKKEFPSIQCASSHAKRIINTKSQTRLSASQRIVNIKEAFYVDSTIFDNRNIIIIDDILTTGATTYELASLLIRRKAKKIAIFTLIKS